MVAVAFLGALAVAGPAFADLPPPAQCPTTVAERPVLAYRSKGSCVKLLGQLLADYDWHTNRLLRGQTVFTAKTRTAVIMFQRELSVEDGTEGVVGEATWVALEAEHEREQLGAAFSARFKNFQIYGASNTVYSLPVQTRLLRAFGLRTERIVAVKGATTTAGANNVLGRLRRQVLRKDIPDLLLVATGVNDGKFPLRTNPKIRSITDPVERADAIREELGRYITKFMSYADSLPTSPPVVWLTVAKQKPDYRYDELWNEALLAEQARRAALDDPSLVTLTILDEATPMNAHPEWYQTDGIHLRPEGYRARAQCIVHALLAFEAFGNHTVLQCQE